MTRSEYQNMIKNSAVYEYLSVDFKDKALKANGDDMARYTALFNDANSLMSRADGELREANDGALKEYKQGLKLTNLALEGDTRKQEEESQKDLLEELENT